MIKIGQQEVIDFLKKNPTKWFSNRDIKKILNISLGSVTSATTILRYANMILWKEETAPNCARFHYIYKYKGENNNAKTSN